MYRFMNKNAICHIQQILGVDHEEEKVFIISNQSCQSVLQQFTQLLEQQANIDQYAEWASNLVDQCLKVSISVALMKLLSFLWYIIWKSVVPYLFLVWILKSLEKDENEEKVKDFSREFLLKWSFFGNQIMRELTLKSAQSFGTVFNFAKNLNLKILYSTIWI